MPGYNVRQRNLLKGFNERRKFSNSWDPNQQLLKPKKYFGNFAIQHDYDKEEL